MASFFHENGEGSSPAIWQGIAAAAPGNIARLRDLDPGKTKGGAPGLAMDGSLIRTGDRGGLCRPSIPSVVRRLARYQMTMEF